MDQCMKHTLADVVDIDLHKQPHRPQLAELQTLYRMEGEAGRRAATRQGLWVAVAVYLLFFAIDILLVPDVAFYTILARLVVGISALLCFEILYRIKARTKWLDGTCAAALVFGYIGWLVPAMSTADTASMSYYMIFGAIFMMGANLFFSFRFRLSVVASGIVLTTFFVALSFFSEHDPAYLIAFGTFYVSCFIFTSYVN